ncbi:BppU family phage baseplate upper protein [Enterococcus faecium]|uniref:BppU family phage baseplate upper protein n=1 Tax=Enterococcus faecium TaxID=1352 RepID=UPI002966713C|nr:BppU family phage baseplate upper protein [Enterococcus faecium]MDW2984598.1 BppU family phage baseplate upper protein [Enterococcus faecium]
MAHVIKKGSITVPTQPKDYDLQATGLVFKSYDNQIALEFNVEQQNGTPADLLGANLRLLMFIYDEVDGMITKEPIPFITKNLITESFLNGQVVYILPEAMKAYNGMVEAYVYIEYPDGSTSDNLGFTFRMKRSAIDGLAQDKADYFIADFQQLLDGVKQEATDAVNEVLAKVEAVSKNVSSAQNDLTILEDRIDQTNQQISDLGKLKKMYSNSIDFGGYDYSGNPNLMPALKAKGFNKQSGVTVEDVGNGLKINFTKTNGDTYLEYTTNMPALLPNTQYTLSADFTVSEGYTGKLENLKLSYRISPTETTILRLTAKEAQIGKKTKISITANSSSIIDPSKFDRMYFTINTASTEPFVGTVLIENIKLERGSTATPYQPNLLDDPYWLGKTPLGENLITNAKFPIITRNNPISGFDISEELIIGETYTVSLKGTKPANKEFHLYYGDANYQQQQDQATLRPVEGLTDVWSATFTARNTSETKNLLRVALWQKPYSATYDTVKIDWLKIEKGDTRTPNISQFKYFGEGLKDSNDPNDYSWDIIPEYAEKSLNNTVSLTEPQTVLGLKNFSDGIQIAGDRVVGENEHVVYTLDPSNSKSFSDGYATFIKHGKTVIANGTVKLKKAYPFGTTLEDVLPNEFVAKIVHGMLTGPSGTSSVSKAMYVRKDSGTIITNSEFAINEWFTFNGSYWVGEE